MIEEYPKMLYAPDGRTHIQASAEAEKPDGEWGETPYPVHAKPVAPMAPAGGDGNVEAVARRVVDLMREEFGEFFTKAPASETEPLRRGPGRPAGSANKLKEE